MGFLCLLFYLVLSYLQPTVFLPELASYRLAMWMGIAGCAFSLPRLIRLDFPWKAAQLYLLIGFLLAIALSQVAQGWLGGATQSISEMLSVWLGMFLILFSVGSWNRLRLVVGTFVVLALLLSLAGILAYHFGIRDDLFLMKQNIEGSEPAKPAELPRIRGLGYLNDPNDLAQALLVALPLLFLARRAGRRLANLCFVYFPASALLYAVYCTHSRGALVALAALAFMLVRRRLHTWKRALPAFIIGVLVLTTFAFSFSGGRSYSSGEESAAQRVDAWSQGLTLLRQSPLFGIGFRSFTDYNSITAHNSFVLCFAETGLFGYFFWIALLYVTGTELRALSAAALEHNDYTLQRWAEAMIQALVAFLVAALFLSRTYSATLYLLIALCTVLLQAAEGKGWNLRPPFLTILPKIAATEVLSIAMIYVFIRIQRLLL